MYIAPSLFGRILSASSGYPVFTASRITVDAGKLGAWRNWNGSDTLTQATAAAQCALPAASSNFRGQHAALFALAQYYVSSAANTFWNFLNNGDGFAIVLLKHTAIAGIQIVVETTPGSTSGVSFRVQASNWNHLVYQSGALVGTGLTAAANTNANQLRITVDATHQRLKKTGSAETSVALAGAASNAQATLSFGSRAGSFPLDAQVCGMFCGPSANAATMATLLAEWSGVAV